MPSLRKAELSARSDHELVQQVASARNLDALQILFERHGGRLYALGLRTLQDETLAEEFVQEVMFDVWRRSPQLHQHSPFSIWLERIAKNLALDHYRKRWERGRTLRDASAGTSEMANASLSEGTISDALRTLPEKESQLLKLRYVDGLSVAQVSKRMHIAPDAVNMSSHQALESLRAKIFRYEQKK